MHALITAYYFLCYSINLVNLALMALLYFKRRGSLLRYELLFMLGLMTISLSLTMPSLFAIAYPPEVVTTAMVIFMCLTITGICLVTGATPAYIHSFRPSRLGRRVSILAWAAAGILEVACLTEVLLTLQGRLLVTCFATMVAAVAWSVGWFLVQVARHRRSVLTSDSARVTLTMSIITVFLMPMMIMVDFMNVPLPFLPQASVLGQRIVFVPLFLAIWSLLLLRKNVPALARLADATPHAAGPAPEDCPDLDCFDLSEREKEVLPLLIEGLSYDEIADRLCISHSTVKTHVRRIYQKTGVSGKIALISRLKGLNHPKG
jgi:DNA-binding CsgD family transcriptional regulator